MSFHKNTMDDYKKLKIMWKKFYRIGQRERNKELTLFPEKMY